MVSNKKLNRTMLVMAIVLNTFLAWIYYTYAPVVLAQEEEGDSELMLYEDATSDYFEQRGYNITIYEFPGNGSLVILAEPLN